jgi:DNA topoisomerase-2
LNLNIKLLRLTITMSQIKRRKAVQVNMRTHIRNRGMWAGGAASQDIETYIFNEEKKLFEITTMKYPPVLMKIFDEIIVNAIDHYVENPTLVSVIEVHLDMSTDSKGTISIMNNGPGITVELVKNTQGVEMYSPQLIFGEYLSGSNLDDDETPERIVGGQNGLGAKITAVFSTEFIVETFDEQNKIFYQQTFSDGLNTTQPPNVIKIIDGAPNCITGNRIKLKKSDLIPHTKITFTPDYSFMKTSFEELKDTLNKIIYTRLWQASAYIKIPIKYNDEKFYIKNFADWCKMFIEDKENIISLQMRSEQYEKYPWELCLSLSDGKEKNLSVVNGLFIQSGGTHIKHIQNTLVEGLKAKIEKICKSVKANFNKNVLLNNLIIFMKGSIPNPQFLGQTKEEIKSPISQFQSYILETSAVNKAWKFLEETITAAIMNKQISNVKTRVQRTKIRLEKYQEANFCSDAKKRLKCGLIIAEGDSAIATAREGLLSGIEGFNTDWFGYFSVQGVIINGLKHSTDKNKKPKGKKTKDADSKDTELKSEEYDTEIKKDPNDYSSLHIPNKMLIDNDRLSKLIYVLGISYKKTYDMTEDGERDYQSLRYGFITALVDQDLDGFNIFGLLATYFLTYWPALVKRGFIKRIITPLIRAYPPLKSKNLLVKEFYTERACKEWLESIDIKTQKMYDIRYYKGLGSHTKKETVQLFLNIAKKICTYDLDEDAIEKMYVFYGKLTKPRKLELATPVMEEATSLELRRPLSKHYLIDTKLYQRDNIARKLINSIDGLVASRRKVLFTVRRLPNKTIKVVSLAGDVINTANYHHGDASLQGTIIHMAQVLPYARNIGIMLPEGTYGSLSNGYTDSAAGRYVQTRPCEFLEYLFRKEDDFLLEYEVDDNKRYEPKYYVPIIPYALCETNEIPATGWAINIHARNVFEIIKNVRELISGKIDYCTHLTMWNKDFKGTIRKYNLSEYSVGTYEYDEDENTLTITELPLGVYSQTYLFGSGAKKTEKPKKTRGKKQKDEEEDKDDETRKPVNGIANDELVLDVEDRTKNSVNIKIILKKGAIQTINSLCKSDDKTFSPIEQYFKLKAPIYHRLNLINHLGYVVEYKNYEDIFMEWYAIRKSLYKDRVEREKILIDLRIELLKNVQRFSKVHSEYELNKDSTIEQFEEKLSTDGYKIFNETLLNNPNYTSIPDLIKSITEKKHGADYNYIIGLRYHDLLDKAYEAREKQLQKLLLRREYLHNETGNFIGAKMWSYELDELEKSLIQGLKTNWYYGSDEYNYETEKKSTKK